MSPQGHMTKLALGVALALMASCRGPSVGTALFVSVEFDSNVEVTQLNFSASIPGRSVLMQTIRPEVAAEALSSPQTLRVRLPDAVAGETVTISVGGLRGGQLVATGEGEAVARQGLEIEMTVVLKARDGADGGPDPGVDGGPGCLVNGTPVDPLIDPNNCGLCGHACPTPVNARATCKGGSCDRGPCAAGFFDIDGAQTFGCEATCSQRVCSGTDGGRVTVSNDPLPETGLVFQAIASGSSYGAAVQTSPADTNLAILGEPTPSGVLGAVELKSPAHRLMGGFSAAQTER